MTSTRPKGLPPGSFVTLAEALTWLAFGNVKNREDLNRELALGAFGIDLDSAQARLTAAVSSLIDAVENGTVHLRGVRERAGRRAAPGAPNAHIAYFDVKGFRQYDITVDGLRFGQGLAWLPNQKGVWRYASTKGSPYFFSRVTVRTADLRKALTMGGAQSVGTPRAIAPQVSDVELGRWWNQLTSEERRLSEAEHRKLCDQVFQGKTVTRARLRKLRGSRKPGRPPKAP
jgi:hypothetical protein